MYIKLLQNILSGDQPGYGKQGYYLAASGSVAWLDIYKHFAKALANRKVIDSETVEDADDVALEKMAKALQCPKEFVYVQLGGM